MADSSKMLMLGGAAAAAYWYFYLRTPSPVVAAPAAGAAASTAAVPVVPAIPKPKLADVQAATILRANAPMDGLAVDDWGYNLNQVLAPYGLTSPDPMPLFLARAAAGNAAFAAVPGFTPVTFNRGELISAPAYWVVMGPALQSQLGLGGLGLFRGLR